MLVKLDFIFFGGIYKVFEKSKTKNGIEYKPIRVCSYKNEWNNFILFENKVDINSIEIGQGVKITGTIEIDEQSKEHKIVVECLKILDKTKIGDELPSIENEMESIKGISMK